MNPYKFFINRFRSKERYLTFHISNTSRGFIQLGRIYFWFGKRSPEMFKEVYFAHCYRTSAIVGRKGIKYTLLKLLYHVQWKYFLEPVMNRYWMNR